MSKFERSAADQHGPTDLMQTVSVGQHHLSQPGVVGTTGPHGLAALRLAPRGYVTVAEFAADGS